MQYLNKHILLGSKKVYSQITTNNFHMSLQFNAIALTLLPLKTYDT